MSIHATVNDLSVQDNLRHFAILAQKEIGEVVQMQAKGFTRRILSMTPPQGGGKKGIAAKRALEGRILSDLHGIFAPRNLSGSRPEKHTDLHSLYSSQPFRKKNGRWMRMPHNPKYYVDARKFKRLHETLKKRVGRLGGGWNRAAESLGVRGPAWFRRHGSSEGSADVRLRGPRPYISLTNKVPYANQAHMGRLAEAAVYYQRRALKRQHAYLLKKSMRGARVA